MFVTPAISEAICNHLSELRPTTVKVAMALGMRAREIRGELCCFPGWACIQKDTGISSTDTISNALKQLEEIGLLERRSRGYGKTKLYVWTIGQAEQATEKPEHDTSIFRRQNQTRVTKQEIEKPRPRFQPRCKVSPGVAEQFGITSFCQIFKSIGIDTPAQLQHAVNVSKVSVDLFVPKLIEVSRKPAVRNTVGAAINGIRKGHMPAEWSLSEYTHALKKARSGDRSPEHWRAVIKQAPFMQGSRS